MNIFKKKYSEKNRINDFNMPSNKMFVENFSTQDTILELFILGEALLMLIINIIFSNDPDSVERIHFTLHYLVYACIFGVALTIYWFFNRKKPKPIFKYLCVLEIIFPLFLMSITSTENVKDLYFIILVLSILYYNVPFTIFTGLLSLCSSIIGRILYVNMYFETDYDLPYSKVENYYTITSIGGYIAHILIIIVAAIVAKKGKKYMDEKIQNSVSESIRNRDIELASDIQSGLLLNNFPNTNEYELYATMTPAMEVGGDFYDFFEIDENKVALVIADASGKGIAASLFMSLGKALIKSYAQLGNTADKILEKVNIYLCKNNNTRDFITAWIGILDLKTGLLRYANAGHTLPCYSPANDKYIFLRKKPNFVLGAKTTTEYVEYTVQLNPGDKLLLYTDGVTEAHSKDGQLYTDTRLLKNLNNIKNLSCRDTVNKIKDDVDNFQNGRKPYDDITIMAFQFKDYVQEKKVDFKSFPGKKASFNIAQKYIQNKCNEFKIPHKICESIEIACSEILSNIIEYAFAEQSNIGEFKIAVRNNKKTIKITFMDNGKYYNPLQQENPKTYGNLSERTVGGYGIFLTKKLMTNVEYNYDKGYNILTLIKEY